MANRNIKEILNNALLNNNEEAFKLDIYYLAQRVFSLSLEDMLTKDVVVDDLVFNDCLNRYISGEPLYYILKEAPFYGRNYYVDNRVLIPRNETEELVYLTINRIKSKNISNPRILDIGTGSGCIAITLDLELIDSVVTGVDISLDALDVAKKNALNLNSKVNFYQSDCLNEVFNHKEKYHVVVSNPPYIDKDSFVEESVLKFEPHMALFAENRGLSLYERIFKDINFVLEDNGIALFEISPEQEESLILLIKKYLPTYKYEFVKDINNFIRFLIINK